MSESELIEVEVEVETTPESAVIICEQLQNNETSIVEIQQSDASVIAAAMTSELHDTSTAAGMTSEIQTSTRQTLSDGTVVEFVAYDEYIAPDQTLRDAARIILECAEPSFSGMKSSDDPTVIEMDENTQIVVIDTPAAANTNSITTNTAPNVTIIRCKTDPKKGFCNSCQKAIDYKNRKRHLKLVHGIAGCNDTDTSMTECIHPDCRREFYMVKSMLKHLEVDHDVCVETKELSFKTWREFMEWKGQEEDTNYVFFSKRCGETVRGDKAISYFICQRDGTGKPHRKKGYVPTSRTTKKGKVRTNLTCPARIKAYRSKEGVRVVYTFSHNHAISPKDTVHQPLSKNKVTKIKQLLERGVNSSNIHNNLSSAKDDTIREPSYILTKRRIDNIKKKLDKESRLSSDEARSVHLLVSKLLESNSTVVLYLSDFVYDNEGEIYGALLTDPSKLFLILFQSVTQLGVMAKFASNVLILEAGMAEDGFQLVNLIVSDEFNQAYPVAHIITNNLETGLQIAMTKLEERLPSLELSVISTPNDTVYLTAIQNSFGKRGDVNFFSGRWETIREWEKKIRTTVFSSVIRRDLARMLTLILDEPDPTKFEVLMEVFARDFSVKAERFVRYFEKHYTPARRNWANCYRDFAQYGTEDSEYTRKIFSRLDWWVGERPTNKRIDDLINLLVRIDEEWMNQRQHDLLNYSDMIGIDVFSKHTIGMKIPDDHLNSVKLHTRENHVWFLKGEDNQSALVVKQIHESCDADFCWDRCCYDSCAGLCGHMYTCTCEDGTGLCEHIHKARSVCVQDAQEVPHHYQYHQQDQQQVEGHEIMEAELVYANPEDFTNDVMVFVDDGNIQQEIYIQDMAEQFTIENVS